MLPAIADVLAGWSFLARRHGYRGTPDESLLTDALREAAVLAAGHEEDEPAALYFALSRRPLRIPGASGMLTRMLARRQAQAVGLVLHAADGPLELVRLRILRNEIEFDELRADFAVMMGPHSGNRGPLR